MGRKQLPLTVAAAALFALGGGCMTAEGDKTQTKKPDVTQPGVLPPPQETMKRATTGVGGSVVPAGGAQPAATTPPNSAGPVVVPAAAASAIPSLSKLTARPERKIPATDMAVAWRNRIAYLPDPTRNGALQPGIVGQLFLYGGPKLLFAEPDGTLTVDMIDETPRTDGKPNATPERWQFNKEMLKNLRTVDETFGKSYVLFLPWPAYRADITKLRISARYDPDNGHTLYAMPAVITIDTSAPFGAPVWDGTTSSTPLGGTLGKPLPPSGGMTPGGAQPGVGSQPLQPIPISGGGVPSVVPSGVIPIGGTNPIPLPAPQPSTSPIAQPVAPGAVMPMPPMPQPQAQPQPQPMPVGVSANLPPVETGGLISPQPQGPKMPAGPVGSNMSPNPTGAVPAPTGMMPVIPVAPATQPVPQPIAITVGRP